ncbi:MAG TPA: nitrate reductase subunit alpha [Candidatus Azoamicus sp. OHIO1]
MSHVFSRLGFLKKVVNTFSNNHGITTVEDRDWEEAYRKRWQHDKIVRSTHGVNCTGSCSWKIYVKNGIITWETQQTDYPRTRSGMPNHEPRGCQRGASYSWYIYSSARLKYPLVRRCLLELWRESKSKYVNPVDAWEDIQLDNEKTLLYKTNRGMGGFVRSTWDEVNEIIASANIYTIKKYGPDRVIGFSPIPAMSMVSYAAGSRYISLIGGACLSFYDWYCDLPPSSPQTWGEQTDVPESADWYNSYFIILWGSNVPQTRTPDAHFFTEVQYKGAKTVCITSDYSEASKLCDLWLAPKPGTDSALSMAMGHVILKEFYLTDTSKSKYFYDYACQYTDMTLLVVIDKSDDMYLPGRFLRNSDLVKSPDLKDNSDWKTVVFNEKTNTFAVPNGSIGSRWDKSGLWNLKLKDIKDGSDIVPVMSFVNISDAILQIAFPYYASSTYIHSYYKSTIHDSVLLRNVPVKELKSGKKSIFVATVFDLLVANYGINRGLGGLNVASSYDDNIPYTPHWQEEITGVKKDDVISVARQFAITADKTSGKSMIIVGAGMNHWYHMDMNYRGIINMLMMCGCVGQSGGGWAHYVGQEKLRPLAGWLPLAFSLDWKRPPRLMNGTSFFYNHTSQWKYEKVKLNEILSPVSVNKSKWNGYGIIDCNVMAERMGWLPSAPQLSDNPIAIAQDAERNGKDIVAYVVDLLKNKKLTMACEDPDNYKNFPRNMFIWRSNLLGASGKGHEYFLKYLLGTQNAVSGKDIGCSGDVKPKEVVWRDNVSEGKLDLLVTLDFRISTTCLYSDIVLPTASWYEKDDLNTSDMHPFIHPLSAAIDPVWETRSDWEIYKSIAKKFTDIVVDNNCFEDIVKDVVLVPLLHDSPGELGQPIDVLDWKRGEVDLIPGKTMPNIVVVERNYRSIYFQYTSFGPILRKLGNSCKGITWDTNKEIDIIGRINGLVDSIFSSDKLPKLDTAINAAELILTLAPETNGDVALKAWESLSKSTGLSHKHLVEERSAEKIRFRDIQAQPRKILTSPIWSGIESETVSYNSGYTNVHEYIPWRTISGRQQYYQDHTWMRDFGEALCVYRPPIDTKTTDLLLTSDIYDNGNKKIALNFITPHQKWGIHSTYSDNLLMLTLNRGGPVIWISEIDAKKISVIDNDWIEAYNINGSITARAVVSQRVPEGMSLMYHAQERIVNVPLSEVTGRRGGLHNSVTRVTLKPTHMIGGYAQQAWGFNYYGTVGSNRDEFIVVRKIANVIWGCEDNNVANNDGGK